MLHKDLKRIRRLGRYLKRDKFRLVIVLLILIPVALSGAIQPFLVGQAITILRGEETIQFFAGIPMKSALRILIGILFFSVVLRLSLQGFQSYNIQVVGQKLTARIREDLFAHSMSLSLRFHDRMPVGKLLTRLTSDVDALSEVFGSGAVGVLADIVSLFVIAMTMLLIEWRLGLLLLLTQIPVVLFIIWLQGQYRKSNYRVREELSQLNADFQENLQGLEVVQMFRREGLNGNNFNKTGMLYRRAVNGTIFYDSSISAFVEWVSLAVVALVLYIGGLMVTNSVLGLGTLVTFILYSQRLFEPLRQLAERFTQIQGGLTAVERIGELLEQKVEISDNLVDGSYPYNFKESSKKLKGEVVFENVSFSYRDDEPIINDLSFHISPGEHVAIVGPTGSGKTTVIRLLCRLYEPQSGRIFIDGENIRNIPLMNLRKKLGVVLQDTFLFSGNIAENILLDSQLEDTHLRQICNELGLDPLIKKMPKGFKSELRERGGNLSSGERQLLSIARVAIRNPNVLVLDEATAFLDPTTEATLQRDLDRLLEKRTALVIAHRLVTVESADRILVLQKGNLVEEGTHQELRKSNGIYSQLAQLQEKGISSL